MKDGKMTMSQAGKLGWEKSREKREERNKKFRDDYERSPRLCETCAKPIPYEKRENRFCDHSCAARKNNIGVRRHGSSSISHACVGCGDETINPKYCSNRCQRDYEWRLVREEIETTGIFPASNRIIKRYLVEKNGTTCSVCEGKMWMGKPMPLEVDHIDGHWDNNRVENLRMVCGNCGMQLPTYKGRNVGNGRHTRRQRYAEGKSY